MKLSEQLSVIHGTNRIRIIKGERSSGDPERDPNCKILFCGYKDLLSYEYEAEYLKDDPEVTRLIANMEVKHKEYAERGLFPPYEPELTRMYEFNDMTIFLYYDIYI